MAVEPVKFEFTYMSKAEARAEVLKQRDGEPHKCVFYETTCVPVEITLYTQYLRAADSNHRFLWLSSTNRVAVEDEEDMWSE